MFTIELRIKASKVIPNHLKDQWSIHSLRKKPEEILYIKVLVDRMSLTLTRRHIYKLIVCSLITVNAYCIA